ncbi:MAG: hypothetical protein ACI3XR_00775, partial [Eubacteriales bacterium]
MISKQSERLFRKFDSTAYTVVLRSKTVEFSKVFWKIVAYSNDKRAKRATIPKIRLDGLHRRFA